MRALLLSLLVVAAGAAGGAAAYGLERSVASGAPSVAQTADGWRIVAHQRREFSCLTLSGDRLFWRNGAAIEYLDLDSGRLRLLGPGPGMRATWAPAVGERYALWFEAERADSPAVQVVVYDMSAGRRWSLAEIGSVRSHPSISGDVAVWCAAPAGGASSIRGAYIGSGRTFAVAPGDGAPVVSGGLVVWAAGRTGPFVAAELASGSTWPVTVQPAGDRVTGLALAGRTLVWGRTGEHTESGTVSAAVVDGGTVVIARSAAGLRGPAYDGSTVVWGERTAAGGRIMARRLDGVARQVAVTPGAVEAVAVSGDRVAWIAVTAGGRHEIVIMELPR